MQKTEDNFVLKAMIYKLKPNKTQVKAIQQNGTHVNAYVWEGPI